VEVDPRITLLWLEQRLSLRLPLTLGLYRGVGVRDPLLFFFVFMKANPSRQWYKSLRQKKEISLTFVH